ncbi:MAG: T9SS C-terminal target domain-containing protein [Deltaproteobacteria bacterium]|nr:T9SS C-terminal target domain-containing protein [Deltaproteobacteria bacterium]
MLKQFPIHFIKLSFPLLLASFFIVASSFFVTASPQFENEENLPPKIKWQQSIGGTEWDFSSEIQKTSDGGYIMAGMTYSTDGDLEGNHGNRDIVIIKFSQEGEIDWKKIFGGTRWDYAHSIQETSDGGFIVAGGTESDDGDVTKNYKDADVWIIKLDRQGNILWQNTYGGNAKDISYSIQETSDGGFITVAMSFSTDGDVTGNHGEGDYWLIKLDQIGNIQWEKSFGGSKNEEPQSVLITSDQGYIIAGSTESNDGDVSGNHGQSDYWIVKVDLQGNIQWQRTLGGFNWDVVNSIQEISTGGYIIAGGTMSVNGDVTGHHGAIDYWVIKLDTEGKIVWQKAFGGSDIDIATSIIETSDGGFMVAGTSLSHNGAVTDNHGNFDFWLLKLDPSGKLEWQKTFGGSGSETAFSIQETLEGGFIIAGESSSNDADVSSNHGSYDIWIIDAEPE